MRRYGRIGTEIVIEEHHVPYGGDLRVEEGELVIALGSEPQLLATANAFN